MTTLHSPQCSHDESAGASYNLILDHVLSYSGTYELPLRTMYTINATPRSQLSRPTTPTGNKTPTSPQFPADAQLASADFQSSLLTHISKQRSQPHSLPPSFITNFLRKCFPPELELVDFPQALTALDYLKDLEKRRKRELAAACNRVGVSRETLKHDQDRHLRSNPGIAAWLETSHEREHKIDTYYARLYVSLRRWILINELSLQPFLKHNCVAMLNTLYPPLPLNEDGPPQNITNTLTADKLEQQRKGFFEWIQKVERNGPAVLEPLIKLGARSGEENGWPAVRQCLDDYLRVANLVVEECASIASPEDLDDSRLRRKDSKDTSDHCESRGTRKADSGVSFTNVSSPDSKRPSTSEGDVNKDLSARPPLPTPPRPDVSYDFTRAKTGGSTLERITREFRRMRLQLNPVDTQRDAFRSSSHRETRHSRDTSDASGSSKNISDERTGRDRSRSNVFQRSMSRIRARSKSRSRPSTATGMRPADDDVPPTPSLPPHGMYSAFEDDDDDDDDDGRSGRSRFKRSLSLSRPRSSSRSGGALRKMKSFGETKVRGRRMGSDELFESKEMKMRREAWQASTRSRAPTIGAAM